MGITESSESFIIQPTQLIIAAHNCDKIILRVYRAKYFGSVNKISDVTPVSLSLSLITKKRYRGVLAKLYCT